MVWNWKKVKSYCHRLSFDVESLFSNIPIAEIIEFMIEFLEKHNATRATYIAIYGK